MTLMLQWWRCNNIQMHSQSQSGKSLQKPSLLKGCDVAQAPEARPRRADSGAARDGADRTSSIPAPVEEAATGAADAETQGHGKAKEEDELHAQPRVPPTAPHRLRELVQPRHLAAAMTIGLRPEQRRVRGCPGKLPRCLTDEPSDEPFGKLHGHEPQCLRET